MNEQMFKSITKLRMSMLMFYKLYYKMQLIQIR